MRILFIFPDTLTPGAYQGGVAEFLLALPPALSTLGLESIIYTRDKKLNKIIGPRALCTGVDIYQGPFIKPRWYFNRNKLKTVIELCKNNHIDVIHAEGTYTAGYMAWQISKKTNIPYVVTSHSDILIKNSKRMQRTHVQQRCKNVLQHATAVTHLTPIMEQASHQLLDTGHKSTLITNGIDCNLWKPYTNLPEKNYLLAIGRLERGKGFHVLIEMYANLIQQGIIPSLIIAGSGQMENELHQQAKSTGLNVMTEFEDLSTIPEKSIIFTGYVRDNIKKQLIAHCQAICFATQPALWEEAFGIVILEAMAAGKPLISSDTNATRFLQSLGLQALVVTADNSDEWASASYRLLQNANLRKAMGNINLEKVKQFDWQVIAKQYKAVFEKCSTLSS